MAEHEIAIPCPEPMLIVLSGLPGVGKTTIARELARSLAAVYLRIDSIEQARRNGGLTVWGEGYAVAQAVAADNLRAGRIVVADCVNPWPLTRDDWRAVGERIGVPVVEVEFVCSDRAEHRRLPGVGPFARRHRYRPTDGFRERAGGCIRAAAQPLNRLDRRQSAEAFMNLSRLRRGLRNCGAWQGLGLFKPVRAAPAERTSRGVSKTFGVAP